MKYLFILSGIIFLSLATLGIIVPGLPATPFLLLASAAFVKSSPRLYNWLIGHSIFGPLLKDFAEKRGISPKVKVVSIVLMLIMTTVSILFFIENDSLKWIVAFCGFVGTIVILVIKTVR